MISPPREAIEWTASVRGGEENYQDNRIFPTTPRSQRVSSSVELVRLGVPKRGTIGRWGPELSVINDRADLLPPRDLAKAAFAVMVWASSKMSAEVLDQSIISHNCASLGRENPGTCFPVRNAELGRSEAIARKVLWGRIYFLH